MVQIADYKMKQGDTLPTVRVNLLDGTGVPILLAGASGIVFKLESQGGNEVLVEGPANLIDVPTALVEYAWAAEDTADLQGWYQGYFEVNYAGGKVLSVPNEGYISVAFTALTEVVSETTLRLRRMVADRLPRDGDDTDTFWTNEDITDLLVWNGNNLTLAALAGWIEKAGFYAERVTVVESGSERKLSDIHKHCLNMIKYFTALAGPIAVTVSPRPIAVSVDILAKNAVEGVGPIAAPVTPEMYSLPSRMSRP